MRGPIDSKAAVKRIEPGTKFTLTWATEFTHKASGETFTIPKPETALRTFVAGRSKDIVFSTERGTKSYLTLTTGDDVEALPDGFRVKCHAHSTMNAPLVVFREMVARKLKGETMNVPLGSVEPEEYSVRTVCTYRRAG